MATSAEYEQTSCEQGSKGRQPMAGGAGADAPRIPRTWYEKATRKRNPRAAPGWGRMRPVFPAFHTCRNEKTSNGPWRGSGHATIVMRRNPIDDHGSAMV